LDSGITNKINIHERIAIIVAVTIYGLKKRKKLTPPEWIAIISVFEAIFEVKKITEMKTNIEVNKFAEDGMKFR
jgi:hypothetical protein